MIAVVHPGKLSGRVRAPASKSMAHRLLMAAALADKPTRLELTTLNRDIEATMTCLRALGAGIEPADHGWRIAPIGTVPPHCRLDCLESGSTLRFLLPLAAALGAHAVFTGSGRLPERPNAPLVEALRAHGAKIDADRIPMRVSGRLTGGQWTLPGNVSSQYITGLLFALPLLEVDSEICLSTHLESAAYVDMTLAALRAFGITIDAHPTGWRVPGRQSYLSPGNLSVEGDWSAAAFWLAANAMGSRVILEGLNSETSQGDRAAEFLLGQREINVENTPDLAPALAVAAAALPQRTVISGASRLRLKESDRLAAIADMLSALGGKVKVCPDGLIIEGGQPLHGGRVNGANDHRIVMAAAIAATLCDGPVTITDAQAIEKSYPDFFRDFKMLGGHVHVE